MKLQRRSSLRAKSQVLLPLTKQDTQSTAVPRRGFMSSEDKGEIARAQWAYRRLCSDYTLSAMANLSAQRLQPARLFRHICQEKQISFSSHWNYKKNMYIFFKQSKHITVKQSAWLNHDLSSRDTCFRNVLVMYKHCLLHKAPSKARPTSTATYLNCTVFKQLLPSRLTWSNFPPTLQ